MISVNLNILYQYYKFFHLKLKKLQSKIAMPYYLTTQKDYILISKTNQNSQKCLKIQFNGKIVIIQFLYLVIITNKNTEKLRFIIILCNFRYFSIQKGIKQIKGINFLLVVNQKQNVLAFQASHIYQIKSIQWIPLISSNIIQDLEQSNDEIKNINKIFQDGLFYYSQNYQLYKTFTANYYSSKQQQTYYAQFIWNRKMMKLDMTKTIESNINRLKFNIYNENSIEQSSIILTKWCTPIIQGYIGSFEVILPDHNKLNYILISRRSSKKAGTRFFSRGIDDNGNVANYTQSQQIIQYKHFIFTNVQIRGSVPVFFQQIGMQGINIELKIKRSAQLTQKAFNSHFRQINNNYGQVTCINLLSLTKKSQQKLTLFFQHMINLSQYKLPHLNYEYFDFHQQCKDNNFIKCSKLINKITNKIELFGFNSYDCRNKSFIKLQNGIFRTNCLDCLDRTNYLQSRIAIKSFQIMLRQFADKEVSRHIDKYKLFYQGTKDQNSQVINSFNHLWAENGDSVSVHYTGIGSTHTDITKTGKRTIIGSANHKMRSLMRFYTQFTDVDKHEAINQFIGNQSMVTVKNHEILNMQKILAISWQLSNPQQSIGDCNKQIKNNKIFSFVKQKSTHFQSPSLIILFIYIPNKIINWQCNLKNLLPIKKNSNKYLLSLWTQFIELELNDYKSDYVLVDKNNNSQGQLIVFCKRNKKDYITKVEKDQIRAMFNTKQTVLLTKFKFGGQSLVFQAFNMKNLQNFLQYLDKSHHKAFQTNQLGKFRSSSIADQSYRLILGNIGSKSSIEENQLLKLDKKLKILINNKSSNQNNKEIRNILNFVQKNDQLIQTIEQLHKVKQKNIITSYNQSSLEFIPRNNRILFWNQYQKIVQLTKYQNIIYTGWNQELNTNKFNKQHGLAMTKLIQLSSERQNFIDNCFVENQQSQHPQENCVYLEMAYQISQRTDQERILKKTDQKSSSNYLNNKNLGQSKQQNQAVNKYVNRNKYFNYGN